MAFPPTPEAAPGWDSGGLCGPPVSSAPEFLLLQSNSKLHAILEKLRPICFLSLEASPCWDCPGGPVVKNPPCSAGDAGSIPDLELRFHVLRAAPQLESVSRNARPHTRQRSHGAAKEIKTCFRKANTSHVKNLCAEVPASTRD